MRGPLLLVLGLWACGAPPQGEGEGGEPSGDEAPPAPVTVVEIAPVGRGDVLDVLVASATVEAAAAADLTPQASGTVLRVTKEVGDRVRKGEVLAVIANDVLDAGVERARTQVRQLEAQVAELQALASQGAVSAREVRDLGFQLETARAALAESGASARQTRLVAPFDGVVAAREVRVGEPAGAGKRAFQIVDLSTLRVMASLPERDVKRVEIGQEATLVAAYDDSLTAGATVSRVSPVVDPNSGTFQVMLTLDPGAPLRPGQYVSVRLEVDRHAGVLVVPRGALVYDNGRPGLYRVRDAPPEVEPKAEEEADEAPRGGWLSAWFGGEAEEASAEDEEAPVDEGPARVAERVEVTLGLADAATAEIVTGVTEGDPIVVVGQATLKDGARVREPKPASTGEAAPTEGAPAGGEATP